LGSASGSDFLETEIQAGTGKRQTVYIDLSVIHNHLVPASVNKTVPNLMAVRNNVSVVMNGLVRVVDRRIIKGQPSFASRGAIRVRRFRNLVLQVRNATRSGVSGVSIHPENDMPAWIFVIQRKGTIRLNELPLTALVKRQTVTGFLITPKTRTLRIYWGLTLTNSGDQQKTDGKNKRGYAFEWSQ
jgi:hypothetical protein